MEYEKLKKLVAHHNRLPFPGQPDSDALAEWIIDLSEFDGYYLGIATSLLNLKKPNKIDFSEFNKMNDKLKSIDVCSENDKYVFDSCVNYMNSIHHIIEEMGECYRCSLRPKAEHIPRPKDFRGKVMIEIVFESVRPLKLYDFISSIIASDENILNLTLRNLNGQEIDNDSIERVKLHIFEQDVSWFFANLKMVMYKKNAIKEPSLMATSTSNGFDICLMFDDEKYVGTDLSKFLFEYAQELSKKFGIEVFYGGIEPASDMETRIFTGNELGPLKMKISNPCSSETKSSDWKYLLGCYASRRERRLCNMGTIISLLEVISKLETFNEEHTIYATKPWAEGSKALVLNEPDLGGVPEEAEKESLVYFLEISIANEFLKSWIEKLDVEPTIHEKCQRLIQYATNDA